MSLVRVNLFFMSVCGGLMILAVLFLRLLLKNRLPKRTFSILWCVTLLRLLIPFSADTPFGAFPILQNQMAASWDEMAAGASGFPDGLSTAGIEMSSGGRNVPGTAGVFDGGNTAGSGGSHGRENRSDIVRIPEGRSPAADRKPAKKCFSDGSEKWSLFRKIGTTGTILCAAVFLALYINCLGRFWTALPVEDPAVERWLRKNRMFRRVRVCRSDRISSPLTYGIIRPVILLPGIPVQERRELEYILQHEMVHIRRFDGAWKLVMTAALCLHWFNPLVWVMYVFMNRDLELSCDEAVLRMFGTEARKGYALTLIGMEESRCSPMSLYSGFGKSAVEERIGEIMKYKKKTKTAVGMGATLILAVVCMFATVSKAGGDFAETDKDPAGADISVYLPMDPPVGNYVQSDTGDGAVDSGTAAVTGFLPDRGTESDAENGTASHFENTADLMTDRENDYRLIYIKEGMPESEPAQLVIGQGYGILLPREGWTAFGPDGWMSEQNNEVELRVAHFSAEGSDYEEFDRKQIVEALKGQGYQEADNGSYWMYDGAEDRMSAVELRSDDGKDIWGVFYTYPGEAEDGWGVELRAMAQSFSILQPERKESSFAAGETDAPYGEAGEKAAEAAMADWLLRILRDASAGEGHESIEQYLAEDYEVDLDMLDAIREWKEGEIHVRFHPTDDYCTASIGVITTESEEDSRDYLTVELLKEGEDWKICFMGIEK